MPNKDLLNVTNAVSGYGSLGLQAQQCGTQWGKYPTFMLVDVRTRSVSPTLFRCQARGEIEPGSPSAWHTLSGVPGLKRAALPTFLLSWGR